MQLVREVRLEMFAFAKHYQRIKTKTRLELASPDGFFRARCEAARRESQAAVSAINAP